MATVVHIRVTLGQLKVTIGYFLDPVGSLVSTLWVVGGLLVGCHTFSKLVNFECVGMLECV